jgi:hypothetical protein
VVGPACAAALGSHLGSLHTYPSASAVEKAVGLNLKERTSGERTTRNTALHITKRGPGQVRQLLYLATLRLIAKDPIVAAWYRARGAHKANEKRKAVVAVMRKLVRALFHVARGATFDATRLFDTRRLNLPIATDDSPTGVFDVPAATAGPTRSASCPAEPLQRAARRGKPLNKGGLSQPA